MKQFLTSVCGGAVLLAFAAGCGPALAQIENGSQEELWYRQLKENYSSFRAPQTPAPAVYNRSAAPIQNMNNTPAPNPADDPEKAVDRAAAGEEIAPVDKEQKAAPAPAPAPVKEEKVEAKADTKEAAPVKEEKTQEKKEEKTAASGNDVVGKLYTVKAGDSLGAIAKQFYGRASMEDVIFRANTKVLRNRNVLRPGMTLVIPEL